MTTYRKEIRQPWFDWIANGTKTFELRIWRKDWREIKLNDILIVHNDVDDCQLRLRVTGLLYYRSLKEAYAELGAAMAPGFTDWPAVEAEYRKFYSLREEQASGVVAIRVQL